MNERGLPDFHNLAKICRWLHVPVETFKNNALGCAIYYEDQDKLSVIIEIVKNDPNIPDEDKPKLVDIFIAAYEGFAEVQNAQQ